MTSFNANASRFRPIAISTAPPNGVALSPNPKLALDEIGVWPTRGRGDDVLVADSFKLVRNGFSQSCQLQHTQIKLDKASTLTALVDKGKVLLELKVQEDTGIYVGNSAAKVVGSYIKVALAVSEEKVQALSKNGDLSAMVNLSPAHDQLCNSYPEVKQAYLASCQRFNELSPNDIRGRKLDAFRGILLEELRKIPDLVTEPSTPYRPGSQTPKRGLPFTSSPDVRGRKRTATQGQNEGCNGLFGNCDEDMTNGKQYPALQGDFQHLGELKMEIESEEKKDPVEDLFLMFESSPIPQENVHHDTNEAFMVGFDDEDMLTMSTARGVSALDLGSKISGLGPSRSETPWDDSSPWASRPASVSNQREKYSAVEIKPNPSFTPELSVNQTPFGPPTDSEGKWFDNYSEETIFDFEDLPQYPAHVSRSSSAIFNAPSVDAPPPGWNWDGAKSGLDKHMGSDGYTSSCSTQVQSSTSTCVYQVPSARAAKAEISVDRSLVRPSSSPWMPQLLSANSSVATNLYSTGSSFGTQLPSASSSRCVSPALYLHSQSSNDLYGHFTCPPAQDFRPTAPPPTVFEPQPYRGYLDKEPDMQPMYNRKSSSSRKIVRKPN